VVTACPELLELQAARDREEQMVSMVS